MKLLRSADAWLFGYGSPAALGLFRAVFGVVVSFSLLMTAMHFGDWYSETGYVPQGQIARWDGGVAKFSLLHGVTDEGATTVLYGATVLAAILTALGLFTRIATVALWVGVTSLHHRDPYILHSGDTLMRLMLFYLALAPSGAAFSLDRVLAMRKGLPMESVSLWPQRLMQIQVAVLYVATVWHKSFGDTWISGTATHWPLNLAEFDRFPIPAFMDQQPMLALTTWGTLLIELALGTLVFSKPYRKWVLFGGLVLHAGIEYAFNIPMFAFIVTSCYIVFYDGDEVERWMKRVGARFVARQGRSAVEEL